MDFFPPLRAAEPSWAAALAAVPAPGEAWGRRGVVSRLRKVGCLRTERGI